MKKEIYHNILLAETKLDYFLFEKLEMKAYRLYSLWSRLLPQRILDDAWDYSPEDKWSWQN